MAKQLPKGRTAATAKRGTSAPKQKASRRIGPPRPSQASQTPEVQGADAPSAIHDAIAHEVENLCAEGEWEDDNLPFSADPPTPDTSASKPTRPNSRSAKGPAGDGADGRNAPSDNKRRVVRIAPDTPSDNSVLIKNLVKLDKGLVQRVSRATRRECREVYSHIAENTVAAMLGAEMAAENIRVLNRDGMKAGDLRMDSDVLAAIGNIRKYEFFAWYLQRTSLTPEQQKQWLDKWLEQKTPNAYLVPSNPASVGAYFVRRNSENGKVSKV